LADFSSMDLIS